MLQNESEPSSFPLFVTDDDVHTVYSTSPGGQVFSSYDAVWGSHLKFLQKLLASAKRGEDVGYGPIHFAASLGNVELLEFLLSNGLDKDERDKDGGSPLMWVIAADGKEELMDALVDHGASVNIHNFAGESPLFLAAQRALEGKVQYLLENGADVNAVNLDGATCLHAAAAQGDTDLISLLVRYGAHVNAVDEEGDTPLHWAVREGHAKAACLLVHLGADVNLGNEDGESALDLALCWGDKEMAKDLSFVYQNSRVVVVRGPFHLRDEVDMSDVSTDFQDLWLADVKKGGKKAHYHSEIDGVEAATSLSVF